MQRLLSLGAGVLAAVVLALGAPVSASAAPKPAPAPVPTGNDVSWPQCVNDGPTQGPLPSGQAFAIVGLTDGLANQTNPCFATEWDWAQTSSGVTEQDKAAVYVNTANPGLAGKWWPTTNAAQDGTTVAIPTRYGPCSHTESAGCAYVYGWSMANEDVLRRGAPVASALRWWLDVETGNSWSSDLTANRADLEGMVARFQQQSGYSVGVYSTRYQYGQIVGSIASDSNLYPLASWLAGGSTLKGAQSLCSSAPLTTGSRVLMTQYVSRGFDYDVSCIG